MNTTSEGSFRTSSENTSVPSSLEVALELESFSTRVSSSIGVLWTALLTTTCTGANLALGNFSEGFKRQLALKCPESPQIWLKTLRCITIEIVQRCLDTRDLEQLFTVSRGFREACSSS